MTTANAGQTQFYNALNKAYMEVSTGVKSYTQAIIDTITAKNQFTGWHKWNPVWKNLEEVAIDVLGRWELEKLGETNVGRVLPKGYCWFLGYGGVNHFRNAYRNGKEWDWSLPNPYA